VKKTFARSFSASGLGSTTMSLFYAMSPKTLPRKAYINARHLRPFDAIIVPGVPPCEDGSWDYIMKARVLWSYHLYKKGDAKNIIYSGGSVYTPYKEAVIMGLYAQALGVPQENIFCDALAKHSTENVYYSYLLAKELGFKSLALATDPFQSFMLWRFTKLHFGSYIHHLPFIKEIIEKYNHLEPKIDPSKALSPDFVSITDTESMHERISGTMGKGIDWSNHKNKKLPPL
jgi:hypothetical protein